MFKLTRRRQRSGSPLLKNVMNNWGIDSDVQRSCVRREILGCRSTLMSVTLHNPTSRENDKVFCFFLFTKRRFLLSLVLPVGSGRVALELCGVVATLGWIGAEAERYVRAVITNRGPG